MALISQGYAAAAAKACDATMKEIEIAMTKLKQKGSEGGI